MNLYLLIPAIALLVLGVTRGVRRDWKLSILCFALGATLFVIHQRRLVASAKVRAREWRLAHPKVVAEETEMKESSNKPSEAIQ